MNPWDRERAAFKIAATIILSTLGIAYIAVLSCTWVGNWGVERHGGEVCKEVRGQVKDLIFQLLAVALAMMGGKSKKDDDDRP